MGGGGGGESHHIIKAGIMFHVQGISTAGRSADRHVPGAGGPEGNGNDDRRQARDRQEFARSIAVDHTSIGFNRTVSSLTAEAEYFMYFYLQELTTSFMGRLFSLTCCYS